MLSRLILNSRTYANALSQFKPSARVHNHSKTTVAQDAQPIAAKLTSDISTPTVIQQHARKFTEGQDYHNFRCFRVEHVPEFGLTSYTFRHMISGTELWYLDRKDPNNVFSVNFRTTPYDSTGLPHILEHSVLCGSNKYPVRDPFFKMLNRSVATFMNAMTGPDYTLYPFSSMNETDFRNLQKIYLDAVFMPNLEFLDFLQEGWRLEHENIQDKTSEYVFRGVVYNEMKGAFSENSSIFGQNLLNNLLPDHTYGFVSGGNPLEIPKLTHANLVDFHAKYYHPSNSRIFTYGNFDLMKTLDYINREYLCKYDYRENSYSLIPSQKRWDKPRNVHISCRYDSMGAPFEKQNQIAISLLFSDITDIQESFTLHVLSELFTRGPNAPFYKSLIEPNFCGGYNSTTGYDAQVKDTFFSIGLQDVPLNDFPRVVELFDQTVQKVIEEGFDSKHLESILHNMELSLKHQTPQFGMGLLFNSTPLWNHEGDVVKNLFVSEQLATLRDNIEQDPMFLRNKVAQYFANNTHRLTMTMSPDDHYEDNFKTAELSLLKQKVISLDSEQANRIYLNGINLAEAQKAEPNVEVLPCLKLEDVQDAPIVEPIEVLKINDIPTQVCNVQTNGITYTKLYFDCNNLKPDEVNLLPLFCNIITDMGTQKYDFREFDKIVMSKTGGFNLRMHIAENIYDSSTYNVGVLLNTHALNQNVGDMFVLCHELLENFLVNDTERLTMLIDSYVSNMSVGIANAGHVYAMLSSSGLVNSCGKLKSLLSGVDHIEHMKNYVKNTSKEVIKKNLTKLGHKIFNRKCMRVAVNTPSEFYPNFVEHYESFVKKLPEHEVKVSENKVSLLEPSCQHYVMNVPVNYCAKAFVTVPYTHRDHPTLKVITKILSAKYLLPVVREQNGAYGAGAKISSDGMFHFYSYRDPHSLKTMAAFDNSYSWLQQEFREAQDQTIFEAKLGVLQQLDAPSAPGNIGVDFFLYGVSHEMLLNYRKRLLAVTQTMMMEAVEKYLKDTPKHYGKVILGPENAEIKAETTEKWKIIT